MTHFYLKLNHATYGNYWSIPLALELSKYSADAEFALLCSNHSFAITIKGALHWSIINRFLRKQLISASVRCFPVYKAMSGLVVLCTIRHGLIIFSDQRLTVNQLKLWGTGGGGAEWQPRPEYKEIPLFTQSSVKGNLDFLAPPGSRRSTDLT